MDSLVVRHESLKGVPNNVLQQSRLQQYDRQDIFHNDILVLFHLATNSFDCSNLISGIITE